MWSVLSTRYTNGSGDGRRDTTVHVQALLQVFLEDFYTWDYFPQLLKYQDLQNISIRITGFLPEFSRQVTMFGGPYASIFQAEQSRWRQNTLRKHQYLSIILHGIAYIAEDCILRSNPLPYSPLLNLNRV